MCDCKMCKRGRSLQKAIEERDTDKLIEISKHLEETLCEVEDDVAYYRAILDGSWPSSKEQLSNALFNILREEKEAKHGNSKESL